VERLFVRKKQAELWLISGEGREYFKKLGKEGELVENKGTG
jgi:hypothetical protein